MLVHPQVGYITANGNAVLVDEGILDILVELRAHSVETLFSCQGEAFPEDPEDFGRAYVLVRGFSALGMLFRIWRRYWFGSEAYSLQVMEMINLFRYGHQEIRFDRMNREGDFRLFGFKFSRKWSWMACSIVASFCNTQGFRLNFKWPSEQNDVILELLKNTPRK